MTDQTTGQSHVRLDVENHSSIGQFLWIGFYSALLSIPTLTLFRFWERTIVRRHLWGETTLGGEPLEYTGKGSELFIGFLIAIFTVVLPFSIAIVAIQLLLPPEAILLVIPLIYLVMFVLIGAAVFLVRRYQLSRTVWRGVRFEQQGSAWDFGFTTLGYILLTAITFGWFAPAMQLRLERKLWNNAYFGDMKFTYDNSKEARTEPVYLSYILAYIGIIAFYVAIFAATYAMQMSAPSPDMIGPSEILTLYAVAFGGALVLAFFVAWHQAVMVRQITKSISLGDIKLRSLFTAWDVIELIITNVLLIVFTFGFGILAAQMRIWRRICRKLEVEGTLELSRIHQAASRGPKSGEGMADAFDISGGI
ncbi:MAG: DUF898 domain-containing protein [Hyphomonadaceae bacterium]|nr:DUF898 domain-containing protein [Hyphomonadaceae bacterium]